ncbi:MAG: metallophosphoesterase family protein, partial [Acidimicrobiales bacterium]
MRVVALGDAHLGRSYYPYLAADGANQREVDFEDSFTAAIEVALSARPDLVVWLGDIFDHPRPSYRSFRLAQAGLARIREYGVPAVVISGNHDTPRLPGRGSPYGALADAFPEFGFAHRMAYERFDIGDVVVHAVPQMLTVQATLAALGQAEEHKSADHSNLLLTHPRLAQVEPRYSDINEIEVDAEELRADLVLLGHYHTHTQVAPNIWYAGSTDTFSFGDDPAVAKGVVVLDTTSGQCRHLSVPNQRRLVTLETVEAWDLSPHELQDAVLDRVSAVPDGAVARLYIDGVEPEAYRLLELDAVRRAGRAALHIKLDPTFADVASEVDMPDLDSLGSRWARYIVDQELKGFDKAELDRLGREYLT